MTFLAHNHQWSPLRLFVKFQLSHGIQERKLLLRLLQVTTSHTSINSSKLFRTSKDPLWQKIFLDKIEPFVGDYPSGADGPLEMLLESNNLALFGGYFDNRFECMLMSVTCFIFSAKPAYANCKIIALPERYDVKAYTFGFQKNSPLLGLFNYHIRQMREAGTLKRIFNLHISQDQECPDFAGKPLGFTSCFTAFIIFVGGIGLAALIFILENMVT